MEGRFLLVGLLVARVGAFAPAAPIRWGGLPGKDFFLAPILPPNKALVLPLALMISDRSGTLSLEEFPYFVMKPDSTISWNDDLCLEAAGVNTGDVIRVDRCTGETTQLWDSVQWGRQQNLFRLKGSNKCIHVKDEIGLNGAPVELRGCDMNRMGELWSFEAPLPTIGHLAQHSASSSSSVRDVMFDYIWMAGLGALSLGIWLWRGLKTTRLLRVRHSSQICGLELFGAHHAYQGGVSLCTVPRTHHGSVPSITASVILAPSPMEEKNPVAMAFSPTQVKTTKGANVPPPLCCNVAPTRCPAPIACDTAAEGPDMENWREFRAKLVRDGLKLTSEDGGEEVEASAVVSEEMERESVAPANEELLKEQNAALYTEYREGAWAHESPVEPGGLLLRQPLEAQLLWMLRHEDEGARGVWGERLREWLVAEFPSSSASEGASAGEKAVGKEEATRLLEQWSSTYINRLYTYRLAERLISESIQSVIGKAVDGQINFDALSYDQQELLVLYLSANNEWQQVVLVLSAAASKTEGVVLNRPYARSMTPELADLLLNGSTSLMKGLPKVYDSSFVERFLKAFGEDVAVYLGGPGDQGSPAMLVHGFSELSGAVEISPGTRIYTGGVVAAVDAIIEGRRSPLDFRWFIGKHTEIKTGSGAWRPVACARSVALKQCLGLPKPLWHEVLELCGGEMAELSKIKKLPGID